MAIGSNGRWTASSSEYRRDIEETVERLEDDSWRFVDETGVVHLFDEGGRIISVSKPGGYQINYDRDANGVLTGISDNFGRAITFTRSDYGLYESFVDPDGEVYKFEYESMGAPLDMSSGGVGSEAGNEAVLKRVIMPDDTPATDADNPTFEFHYEDSANYRDMTGKTDERGVRMATWTYVAGRPVSYVGPNGFNETTITYNDSQNISIAENSFGHKTYYESTYARGIKKLRFKSGVLSANTSSYYYSKSFSKYEGRTQTYTDELGTQIYYDRNDRGLPETITEAVGLAEEYEVLYEWHPTLPLPTKITTPELETTVGYTTEGAVEYIQQTDITSHAVPYSTNGQVRRWDFTYLAGHLVDTVDGPLPGSGDVVDFDYDSNGNLSAVTNEVGHTTTINSVNGRGQPLTITDPNGVVTNLTYTPRGWVESITVNPGSSQRQFDFDYDDAGNVVQINLPTGGWIQYDYADEGFVSRVETSEGDVAEFGYDLLGNLTSRTFKDSAAATTFSASYAYDELGRLTSLIGAYGQTTSLSYDNASRLVGITDPRGKLYSNAFDALYRILNTTDPNSDIESVGYDDDGNIDAFTDGGSVSTTFVHNGFGEVIREDSPDRGIHDYWYDEAGRVTRILDAEGIDKLYTYDDAGRMLSESFVGASYLDRTFTYDDTNTWNYGIGRLASERNDHSIQQYYYNAFGELKEETVSYWALTSSTTVKYTYDSLGQINRVTYPSGRQVAYTRDGLGRITTVEGRPTSNDPYTTIVSNVARSPFGPVAGYLTSNGLSVSYDHNLDYQVSGISVGAAPATNVLDINLGYDLAGNVTSISDLSASARSSSYTYTDDNRIASADGPWGDKDWTYDGGGNRLSETLTLSGGGTSTENYLYNSGTNQLRRIEDPYQNDVRTFAYMDNGKVQSDNHAGNPFYWYVHDFTGRLTQVWRDGVQTGYYYYDARGRRISREVFGAPGLTRFYVFNQNDQPLMEMDEQGQMVREYVWMDGRLIGVIESSGDFYHVHTGHLGQPLRMTDINQNVVWDVDVEPFGATYIQSSTAELNLRLPGQWEQYETGLFQNQWRDYDPSLGRYLDPDPIGLMGGSNVYNYVGGNPFGAVDPSGLDIIVLFAPHSPPWAGHVGVLIGNEAFGFSYSSIDGYGSKDDCGCNRPNAEFGIGEFGSPDDFFRASTPDDGKYDTYGERYLAAYRIETSLSQDVAAWFSMQDSARKRYNWIPNTSSCHEAVSNALEAAGLDTPRGDLTPRRFFSKLKGGAIIRKDGRLVH